MNINSNNLILGRMAAFTAKQLLLGEKVNIINCELAVISGKRKNILERYYKRYERGDPHHGPYFPRNPRDLVRRTIRGMLPWQQSRGREAFKRLRCYVGMPERFKKEKVEDLKKMNVSKISGTGFISVKELCKELK